MNASPTSGSIDQATYIGGAPITFVTPSRRTSSRVSTGSKRSDRTPVAPCHATDPRAAFNPKTWNSGSTSRTTSSAVTAGGSIWLPCSRLASSARWLSIAPLGRPLVPDV